MSDRCYMQVTCRRQDQTLFEELGFHLEFEQSSDSPIVEIIDEAANYAHAEHLPTDIPFTAWHGAGDNYGDGNKRRNHCRARNCRRLNCFIWHTHHLYSYIVFLFIRGCDALSRHRKSRRDQRA